MSLPARRPSHAPRQAGRSLCSAALLLATACVSGCLERTIVVTSTPPGATVWLNDVEVGQTPVQAEFEYYGLYDVRLRLEGYEPVWTSRRARVPIYEYPGLDLIAEAVPARVANRVEWHFDLAPIPPLREGADSAALQADLLERARALREDAERDPGRGP